MAKAVFLDRDGVLNQALVRDGKPYPPETPEELHIYAEAAPALARLKAAGFLLIVVTNQPDVGRGTQSRQTIDAMEALVRAALPLDDVLVCCHDDRDRCVCRKPKPGMLLEAADRYGVDLAESFMVGDRWRDIDAGANAGVRTILIDRRWQERGPEHAPDFRAGGIAEAADLILAVSRVP
ncbi:MAG TPA: HAD family hydrolase [Candidatus Acidoferrales bacterium]|nr:HAD family hydrolase [Candidatus Acidoferrales bacterium]